MPGTEACVSNLLTHMTNRNIIIVLFLGTTVLYLLLRWQGRSLEIPEHSPAGIVSLELSATPAVAGQVLNAWDGPNIQVARRNVLLEFIFIFFYSWMYYTLCGNFAVRQDQGWSRVGVLLAIGSMLAALFNVFENILLLFTLSGNYTSFSLLATTTLASLKFFLLLLATIYVFIGAWILMISRLERL